MSPGLKILFEPKSQRSAKCGDLLLRYQPRRANANPRALMLLEFRVCKAQSPPAQQLQNVKHVYRTYQESGNMLAVEVTAGFLTTLLVLDQETNILSHDALIRSFCCELF